MGSNSIYTGKTGGLDKKVWGTMIGLIILSSILLGYRLAVKKECPEIHFTHKSIESETAGNTYRAGDPVIFRAITTAKKVSWDFGDNSPTVYEAVTQHTFSKEGEYLVKLNAGLDCFESQKIIIVKADKPANAPTGKEIEGNSSTLTQQEEVYTCAVTADFYEWEVDEHPEMGIQNSYKARFRFNTPGTYVIKVRLNRDRSLRFTKEVVVEEEKKQMPVTPLPVQPDIPETNSEPEPPATKFIPDETLQNMFQQVVNGEDFKSLKFEDYLCGGLTTPVKVNKKEPKAFNLVCQELKGKKRNANKISFRKDRLVQIDKINVRRNDKTGCIEWIEIHYE